MDKAYNILRKRFGFIEFLPSQKIAVENCLTEIDVIVIAKTSAGKSLCYQLPALCQSGITIIISPLKSLIDDQVNNLLKKNIECFILYGGTDLKTKNIIFSKLLNDSNESILLYTTPETLEFNNEFNSILEKSYRSKKIRRFVIDEAHTISTWGHEFRPSYLNLSFLRKKFKKIPITALTATATLEVKADIIDILGMKNYKLVTQNIVRNNLFIDIISCNSNLQQKIVKLIKDKFYGKSGIIYCNSRQKCEEVNYVLKKNSINSHYYHAGLDSDERYTIQNNWKKGDINIIVATIAFGMGIDKEDVRFVIHYNIPKNIESYYQEIGRAGRDGKLANCILYLNDKDISIYNSQIKKKLNDSSDAKEKLYLNNQLNKLEQMNSFIKNDIDCRQYLLNYYFGITEDIKCNNCDNCNNKDENYFKEDVTDICIKIIEAIKYLKKDADKYKIKKILYSSEKNKSLNLSLYGTCIKYSSILFDRTFIYLVTNNYINETVVKINGIWYSRLLLNQKSNLIKKDNDDNKIFLYSSKNKTTIEDFFSNKKNSFFIKTEPLVSNN